MKTTESTPANAAPSGIAAAIAAKLAAMGVTTSDVAEEAKDFAFGEIHISTKVAVLVGAGLGVIARADGQIQCFPLRGHDELAALVEDIRLAEAYIFRPRRGAPRKIVGGKAQPLYLDDESLAIADRLGKGNMSAGARYALWLARDAAPLGRAGAEQKNGR